MGVLAEYVRKEADHLKDEVARRKRELDEWMAAIHELYGRLGTWLREADGGTGLLPIEYPPSATPLHEFRLGSYAVSNLRVHLGGPDGPWAEVAPKARFVAGVIEIPGEGTTVRQPEGLVEICDDRFATHYLYRLAGPTPAEDRWFIREAGVAVPPGELRRVDELTQERFEAALLRALR